MARTESQLEIYKIILGRKTMRQIIIDKEHIEEAIDDNNLFNRLFSRMLHAITQDTA